MVVAYLLFGRGPRTVRGSTVTSITLVKPHVATLSAVLIVGERLPLTGWAELGLVLMAVTVLVTNPKTTVTVASRTLPGVASVARRKPCLVTGSLTRCHFRSPT